MTSFAERGPAGEFVGHDEVISESIDQVIARIAQRKEMAESAAATMLTPPNGRTEIQHWMAIVSTPQF